MSSSSERICDDFACARPATRRVRWEHPSPGGGQYCDEHAETLWLAGDVVIPPFDLAPVHQLHGGR